MKLQFLILFFLLFSIAGRVSAHDYHTSITDIKFNPKTKSLEVAMRLFMDDLENGLSKFTKSKVVYDSKSAKQQNQLFNYLKRQVSFEVSEGKALPIKLLGSEPETDAVWIYMEVPVQADALQNLTVKNAVLTEVFNDQMNIVNLEYKGKKESTLLQRGEEEYKFSL